MLRCISLPLNGIYIVRKVTILSLLEIILLRRLLTSQSSDEISQTALFPIFTSVTHFLSQEVPFRFNIKNRFRYLR